MAFKMNARIFHITILIIVIPNFGNTNADCPSCFDMLLKLFRLEHDQRIMMGKLEEQNNAIVSLRQSATACLPVIRHMYLGCYVDKEDRLLDGEFLRSDNMTTKTCLDFCIAKGMRFFLTEFTTYCFCGNELKNYEKRPNTECNYVCAGDSNEMCGGYWRGSLYDIASVSNKADLSSPIEYVYLGCYVDKWDRLLEDVHIENQNMTTKMCLELCVSKEMRFFLTEFSSHCFCGQRLKYIEKRPDSECNNKCSGNNTETCGGFWRSSVYDTEPDDVSVTT